MSEPEKRKKELLAAITDGLDVLLGIEKEERKEVRPERQPADTFGGLLQSLIPLVILPSIMPLFQQAFGQTLRETTVNVKVESATSIIPIDITTQTAILAVDIRAQTVTLNIRIIESTTTLAVDIRAQSTVLDIRITGSTTTLNVSVQGDASIVISGQSIGVALTGTWQTFTGYNKVFWAEGHAPGIPIVSNKFANTLIQYIPPANRELYVESINMNVTSRTTLQMGNVYGTGATYWIEGLGEVAVDVIVYIGGSIVAKVTLGTGNMSVVYQPITPLRIPSGIQFKVEVIGNPYGVWTTVTVLGYEKATT